jgi:hypothetical protein
MAEFECSKCKAWCSHDNGDVPSEFCSGCAHDEIDRLRQLVADFQAAAMLEVGGVGDPSLVEPRHVETMITRERAAADGMAAALDACLPWSSTKVAVEDAVAAYRRARAGDAR